MQKRLILYPSDLVLITGKGEKTCRRIYNSLKQKYGKQNHHLLTVKEYAVFFGISEEEVYKYIH